MLAHDVLTVKTVVKVVRVTVCVDVAVELDIVTVLEVEVVVVGCRVEVEVVNTVVVIGVMVVHAVDVDDEVVEGAVDVVDVVVDGARLVMVEPIWLVPCSGSPRYSPWSKKLPGEVGVITIEQAAELLRSHPESALGPRVVGPLKRTGPVGIEDGTAVSRTVAVHVVEEPNESVAG